MYNGYGLATLTFGAEPAGPGGHRRQHRLTAASYVITRERKPMVETRTAHDTYRTLTERDPGGIVGRYDDSTHTLTLFRPIVGSESWQTFQRETDRARKKATMRPATITGIWVADPMAPRLISEPVYAVTYDQKRRAFFPALNITITRRMDFFAAMAEANAAAAEAELFRDRYHRLPLAEDLETVDLIMYPSTAGTDAGADVADLLERINGRG